MKVKTRLFGEINVGDNNIMYFGDGIIGFPELQKFTIIKNKDKPNSAIMWLQSLDEGSFAMPVLIPNQIIPDYAPSVADGAIKSLGENVDINDLMLLVTITVPSDLEKMTVNLKAPIIINHKNLYACQAVAENEDYLVKYPIYELLQKRKAGE